MSRWVVVGAGAAGCVVAARLAAAGHDVVLLEAGSASTAVGDDWFAALDEPGRTYPGAFRRGRGLGGSTAVNGMLATVAPGAWSEAVGITDVDRAVVELGIVTSTAAPDEIGPVGRALLAASDSALVPLTRMGGRRVSAADAVPLAPVDVRLGAEAARIRVSSGRVVEAELTDGEVVAADGVVVTAGAIGSPLLLAASGLGGPSVGRGLQNHVGVPITLRRRDDAASSGLVAAAHLRRDDIEIVALEHLGADAPGLAMLLVIVMSPTGRGSVRAGDDGVAVVDHVLSAHDRARADAGVDLALGLLDHPAFTELIDDVEVGTAPAGVFHPTSTCAIGSVVDATGAVHGVSGLYVADASVFPSIPSTHTMLPTMLAADALTRALVNRGQTPIDRS